MRTKARKTALASLAPIALLALAIVAACALAQSFSGRTAASTAPSRGVVINEVMTKNTQTLEDDFGGYPDWIELTNAGIERVDLSGWMLTGGKDAAAAFVFSGEAIEPGQTLLVFASGRSQTRSGYVYHAPFKLSASGDTVALYDRSGLLADSLDVPALESDTAWARGEDGSFAVAAAATPGLPNDAAYAVASAEIRPGAVQLAELVASNTKYAPDENGAYQDYILLR
ncbi:MAG: lamin tail domain-containing protein, partial [Clostridia bacterium]|nr:lamin tail domain-containing protein [Clostridia bacterium]